MQRPAGAFGFAFTVQRFGNRVGVGVEFNYSIDRRTFLVETRDSFQISFHQRLTQTNDLYETKDHRHKTTKHPTTFNHKKNLPTPPQKTHTPKTKPSKN